MEWFQLLFQIYRKIQRLVSEYCGIRVVLKPYAADPAALIFFHTLHYKYPGHPLVYVTIDFSYKPPVFLKAL